MISIKFMVKVNRKGTLGAEYVRRIDPTPIQTTFNRKLALKMGKFTAEDAAKAIRTSNCTPELVSVKMPLRGQASAASAFDRQRAKFTDMPECVRSDI